MVLLSKKQLRALFESNEKVPYKKLGRFLSRCAVPGETILSIVDGKLETMKIAPFGDVVLRNIQLGSSA